MSDCRSIVKHPRIVDKAVNMKRCECGCGTKIPATNTRGEPARFKHGHNARKHPGPTNGSGRRLGTTRCYECGARVLRRVDEIRRHGLRQFCSKECIGEYQSRTRQGTTYPTRRTGGSIVCEVCEQAFYVPGSSLATRRFCSRKCYSEWLKENGKIALISSVRNRNGKRNPNYRHGQRVGEKAKKDALRNRLIERSGGVCEMPDCSNSRFLHKHRIVYGSQGGEYVEANTALICPDCHELVHTSKAKWQPILFSVVPRVEDYAQAVLDRIAVKAGRRHER